MDHLSTDDQQWQTKALQLAEKKSSFDVHDLKAGADTTFVIELANKYAYPRPVRRAGAGFYVLGRRSSDGSGIHDPGSRRRDRCGFYRGRNQQRWPDELVGRRATTFGYLILAILFYFLPGGH